MPYSGDWGETAGEVWQPAGEGSLEAGLGETGEPKVSGPIDAGKGHKRPLEKEVHPDDQFESRTWGR
jgi:hypothetical protein